MSNANPLENRTYHQPIWGKHVAREFYNVQHFERAAELVSRLWVAATCSHGKHKSKHFA